MKSLDDVFALFSKERRRFVLYYLDHADGKVSIGELVEQIHEWETSPPHDSIPDEEYEELVVSLEHNHLPKIENATHIEYYRENQQIRISALPAEVDVLLSVSKAIEQPSSSTDLVFGDNI